MDAPDDELQNNLISADMDLVIWEVAGRSAGFALFDEIGEPSGRIELRRLGLYETSKGQGGIFLLALVNYGFDAIGAARIWLDVVDDDPRAHATYKRAGFTHEGTLRQNWRRPTGDVADMMIFGMLRKERP